MTVGIETSDDYARRTRALRRRTVVVRIGIAVAVFVMAVAVAACVDAALAAGGSHASAGGSARHLRAAARDPSTPAASFGSSRVRHAGVVFDAAPFIGHPIRHGDPATDMVALTFDDGPSVDSTAVLEVLEREHAAASFFYVGDRVFGHPLIPARAVADGFDVGDHTLHHVEMVGLTQQHMLDQILPTNSILQKATGEKTLFFRPRSGHADAAARALVARLGMIMVLWDARDGDTDPAATVAGITRQAVAAARGGSIVLMHETNPKTVEALPGIIAGLRAKGLVPVTLSAMLAAERKPGVVVAPGKNAMASKR
jgi:peptidoglycan/xylan/chitin deacetylase (PgdA/CDA1 family)